MGKETGRVEQQRQPAPAESIDERIAEATPEQVARAIFAAVAPPDPRKQRPAAERERN